MSTPPPDNQSDQKPATHAADHVELDQAHQVRSRYLPQQTLNDGPNRSSIAMQTSQFRPEANTFRPHSTYYDPPYQSMSNPAYGLHLYYGPYPSPSPAPNAYDPYTQASHHFSQRSFPTYPGPDTSMYATRPSLEYNPIPNYNYSLSQSTGGRNTNLPNTYPESAMASTDAGSSPCDGPTKMEDSHQYAHSLDNWMIPVASSHTAPTPGYAQFLNRPARAGIEAYRSRPMTHPALGGGDQELYARSMAEVGYGRLAPSLYPSQYPSAPPTTPEHPMFHDMGPSFVGQSSYDLNTTSRTMRLGQGNFNAANDGQPKVTQSQRFQDLQQSDDFEGSDDESHRSEAAMVATSSVQPTAMTRSCYCGDADDFSMIRCSDPDHPKRSNTTWVHSRCAPVSKTEEHDIRHGTGHWVCEVCTQSKEDEPHSTAAMADITPVKTPSMLARSSRHQERPPGLSRPSSTRSHIQKGSWTEMEEIACIKLMRQLKVSNYGTIEDLWYAISYRLRDMGIDRTPAAVKNQWNRRLRAKSGFDERAKPKPNAMRTGILEHKVKSSRQPQTEPSTPANAAVEPSTRPRRATRAKSIDMVEQSFGDTESASGSEDIFESIEQPVALMTQTGLAADMDQAEDSDESYHDETVPDLEDD